MRQATTPPPFRVEPATWTPTPDEADDLVAGLERLAQLHAKGKLDDDEFAAAKSRLIREAR